MDDVRTAMTATIKTIGAIADPVDAQANARDWSIAAGSYIERFGDVRRKAIAAKVAGSNRTQVARLLGMSRQRVSQILNGGGWPPAPGKRPKNDPLIAALDAHLARVAALEDPLARVKECAATIEVLVSFQRALRVTRSRCIDYVTRDHSYREAAGMLDMPHQRVHRYAAA